MPILKRPSSHGPFKKNATGGFTNSKGCMNCGCRKASTIFTSLASRVKLHVSLRPPAFAAPCASAGRFKTFLMVLFGFFGCLQMAVSGFEIEHITAGIVHPNHFFRAGAGEGK